jgi:hypothetical protein
MKTIFIACMCWFSLLPAQNTAPSIPHFTRSINLDKTGDEEQSISFSVNSESNIKCYIIEGSNDNVNYELVVTIPCPGNTVIPRRYEFESALMHYSLFRIKQMDFTSTCIGLEELHYNPVKMHDLLPPDKEERVAKH